MVYVQFKVVKELGSADCCSGNSFVKYSTLLAQYDFGFVFMVSLFIILGNVSKCALFK